MTARLAREYTARVESRPTQPITARMMFCSVIRIIGSDYKLTTTLKGDVDILKLVAVVDRLNERREHHLIEQLIKGDVLFSHN